MTTYNIIDFDSDITKNNISDASFKVDNSWENSYFSYIYLRTFEPIYPIFLMCFSDVIFIVYN